MPIGQLLSVILKRFDAVYGVLYENSLMSRLPMGTMTSGVSQEGTTIDILLVSIIRGKIVPNWNAPIAPAGIRALLLIAPIFTNLNA